MALQVSTRAPAEAQEKRVCRHHWIIESPTGPLSKGICRLCGGVKEFKNYIETLWEDDDLTACFNLSTNQPLY